MSYCSIAEVTGISVWQVIKTCREAITDADLEVLTEVTYGNLDYVFKANFKAD